jgi:hypothetical protein
MGRNQATPVDAPAPKRVHRLPFQRLASRRRQANHRVKVVAATMTLETPQIRISRQIPGAAGSDVFCCTSIGRAAPTESGSPHRAGRAKKVAGPARPQKRR